MKKLLIALLLLLFTAPCFSAENIGVNAIPIGLTLQGFPPTTALNSTTTFSAFSFIPTENKTINSIRFVVSAVAGTIGAGDIEVHVYSSATDGKPNTSVSSSTTITTTPPAANTVVEATGFTYVTTAGSQYWVVIKCPDAGAGNYVTVRRFYGSYPSIGNGPGFGVNYATTTDGSAWTVTASQHGASVGYSDGTITGPLLINEGAGSLYGSGGAKPHIGFAATTPANAKVKIRGAYFYINKTGTPTGNLTATLRVGGSTYTSINSIPASMVGLGVTYMFYFSETVVAPSTALRVTLDNSAADDASNYFRVMYASIPNVAADKALVPMGIKYTISSDNAATFTDDDAKTLSAGLLLLGTSMFDTQSAGSSGGAYVH